MSFTSRICVAAVVLASLLPGASVRAEDSPEEVVIASGSIQGPGWFWVSLREGTPGRLTGDFYAYELGSPSATGHMVEWTFGYGYTFYKEGVRAQWGGSSFEGGDLDVEDPRFEKTGLGGFILGPNWRHWQDLLWIAGNVSHWTYEIRGPRDAEIVELEIGDSVFLHRSHDFSGEVEVEAHTPLSGGRLQSPSFLDLRFSGRWAGVFTSVSIFDTHVTKYPGTKLDWTRPGGAPQKCPCFWTPFMTELPLAPPGLHRFEMTSASAGLNSDEVFITGVDFGNFTSESWT